EVVEIHAGGKAARGAGEDDDSHRGILAELTHQRLEAREQRQAQGVLLLGAIEREERDLSATLDLHRRLRHHGPSETTRGLRDTPQPSDEVERPTGFEPATSSLGSWHSATELRPLVGPILVTGPDLSTGVPRHRGPSP